LVTLLAFLYGAGSHRPLDYLIFKGLTLGCSPPGLRNPSDEEILAARAKDDAELHNLKEAFTEHIKAIEAIAPHATVGQPVTIASGPQASLFKTLWRDRSEG